MRSLRMVGAFCAGLSLVPGWAFGEEFPATTAGYPATLFRIAGMNTARARAYGEVRRENAESHCRNTVKPDGEQKDVNLRIALCTEDILTVERGRVRTITADCPKKSLTTAAAEQFSLTFRVTDGGSLERLWRRAKARGTADGEVRGGDAAMVDALFRALCPSFVQPPALPSRPAIR